MCTTPLALKSGVIVPCSKCPECKARRVSAWSLRLMRQDSVSDTSHFITLTYDNEHLPRSGNGLLTLSKRDLQLFFKRLRFLHVEMGISQKIKYYVCGEYGFNTKRPHYHAIIFNVLPDKIADCWKHGTIHIGTISEASVGYTLKYISKGSTVPRHSRDDRQKEFSLMSKV